MTEIYQERRDGSRLCTVNVNADGVTVYIEESGSYDNSDPILAWTFTLDQWERIVKNCTAALAAKPLP